MHPYRDSAEMLAYRAEFDIALTHAFASKRSRIRLCTEALRRAHSAALALHRPDLAWRANELLAIVAA